MENKNISPQRRIKSYMVLNKIKMKDLAERLNITRSAVTQLLSDENDMRLSTIQKIGDALGCDLDEFFN